MKEAILEAMFADIPQIHNHEVREILPAYSGLCIKEFQFIEIDVDVENAKLILRTQLAYPDKDILRNTKFDLADPHCFIHFHQKLKVMLERAPALVELFTHE
jgi:hypothetical protein